MNNQDIRQEAKHSGVMLWRIADELGVCDMTLTRRLRRELPEREKARIREIIARIVAEREASEEA